jgi:hypothetical protein
MERKYSSCSFSTSALDGGEWSASFTGLALPPGKGRRFALYRRLCGPQLVWTQKLEEKTFASAGDLTPVFQSAVTLYWLNYPGSSSHGHDLPIIIKISFKLSDFEGKDL